MRSAYIVFRVGCDAADSVTATGPMAAASGIISQAPPTGRRDWSVGGTRHTSFMTSRSAAEPRLRAADQ